MIPRMLTVPVTACLLVLCACSTSRPTPLEPVTGGYRLALPAELEVGRSLEEATHLFLFDRERGISSVEGRVALSADGSLVFASDEELLFTPERGTTIVLATDGEDEFDTDECFVGDPCGCAEFGPRCRLTLCAGTVFCLPGPDNADGAPPCPETALTCTCLK